MSGLSDEGDWVLFVFKRIIGVSKGEGLATEGRAGRVAGNALAEVTTAIHMGRRDDDLGISRGEMSPAELEKLPLGSGLVLPAPRCALVWLG